MFIANRGIVLAEFGNREQQIRGLLQNLRTVCDLPVMIYSDRNYPNLGDNVTVRILKDDELFWKGHRRYLNRNNDYWKIRGAFREEPAFNLALILDDDMRIVNTKFTDGFDLAERYGLCLPQNPRIYFGIDCDVGDDVSDEVKRDVKDIPYHMTANNMGVVFLDSEDVRAERTMSYYLLYMQSNPCRGPVAMAVSCWHNGFAPYFLPEEWCACGGYVAFRYRSNKRIQPIFLHIGHRDVDYWYTSDPAFADFRG